MPVVAKWLCEMIYRFPFLKLKWLFEFCREIFARAYKRSGTSQKTVEFIHVGYVFLMQKRRDTCGASGSKWICFSRG